MSDPDERLLQRGASNQSIPRRCRQRTFNIPRNYEDLENSVAQWMAGCVVTNSIQDDRGIPMNRHQSLVYGNPTLIRDVWNRIVGREGTVVISARHLTNGHRTNEIIFSIVPRRIARVRDPDDFEILQVSPIERSDLQTNSPTPPDIPDPPNPLSLLPIPIDRSNPRNSIRPDNLLRVDRFMTQGLKYLLKGYLHTLGQQYDGVLYRGAVNGFLDSLARAAVSLNTNNLRVRGSLLIDVTSPIPRDIRNRYWQRPFLRGYRSGRLDAHRMLRSQENITLVEGPIRYRSTEMLLWLKSTYRTREGIFNALKEMFESEE